MQCSYWTHFINCSFHQLYSQTPFKCSDTGHTPFGHVLSWIIFGGQPRPAGGTQQCYKNCSTLSFFMSSIFIVGKRRRRYMIHLVHSGRSVLFQSGQILYRSATICHYCKGMLVEYLFHKPTTMFKTIYWELVKKKKIKDVNCKDVILLFFLAYNLWFICNIICMSNYYLMIKCTIYEPNLYEILKHYVNFLFTISKYWTQTKSNSSAIKIQCKTIYVYTSKHSPFVVYNYCVVRGQVVIIGNISS